MADEVMKVIWSGGPATKETDVEALIPPAVAVTVVEPRLIVDVRVASAIPLELVEAVAVIVPLVEEKFTVVPDFWFPSVSRTTVRIFVELPPSATIPAVPELIVTDPTEFTELLLPSVPLLEPQAARNVDMKSRSNRIAVW